MGPFRLLLLGASVVAIAAAAVLAPLWTYALSLALFGLPHVLTELRYVDERFGARLGRATVAWLVIGLAGIVLLRLLALGGAGHADVRVLLELLVGAMLVGAAVPLLAHRGRLDLAASLSITALLAGAWWAPFATIVVLALLHNLTPVGFLAERLRGRARRAALLACVVVFGAMPLLIAGGAFGALLDTLALRATDAGPFATGELDLHLAAYVPPALLDSAFAFDLFAAAAYLQCMHYAVVLLVLPRLSGGSETAGARLPWPRPAMFIATTVAAGAVATIGFLFDFHGTRDAYAVLAAVHAWLEIPVLALACGVGPHHEPAVVVAR